MKRRFTQLDVFASGPLSGNALAVVVDGDGLDDAQMAAFARWTQLSETTFLLPPTDAEADYRVRIFTPGGELPFAGHPTLGSAYAWLAAGGKPRRDGTVVQQCGVGRVEVRQDGDRLAFAAPPMASEPVEPALLIMVCEALGVDPEAVLDARWLDNGLRWLALRLSTLPRIALALEPDHATLKSLGVKVGVDRRAAARARKRAFEVRSFVAHRHRRRSGDGQPQRQPCAMAGRRRAWPSRRTPSPRERGCSAPGASTSAATTRRSYGSAVR